MSIADPISRELGLDLSQPGLYLRPDYFDLLATLREQAPVARTVDGKWAVTRYDDIRAISRDPVRYVSGRGVLVNDPLGDQGSGNADVFSLLHLDPPLHSVYRKVVNRQFTPKRGRGKLTVVLVGLAGKPARPIEWVKRCGVSWKPSCGGGARPPNRHA